MAEDNNVQEHGGNADVSTLDALHLDGKGLPGLEDADEQSLPDTSEVEGEDVKGFANVQSAQRTTFEKMQQGAPPPLGAVPVGDRVVADVVIPSEPDNAVEARFENPFPAFTPEPEAEEEEPEPKPVVEAPRAEEAIERERPIEEAPGRDRRENTPAAEEGAPEISVLPPELPPEPTEPPVPTEAQSAGLLVADATGTEDVPTKLNISYTTNDTDGGGDTVAYVEISGIPDYFVIVDSNGNPIGTRDGSTWRLENPTLAEMDDIYLKNVDTDDDADFSGTLALKVSVGTLEPNGTTALVSDDLNVTITAVADAPVLQVADSADMENSLIPLSIDVTSKDAAQEAGTGANAAETQSVYISGVPAGAKLFIGGTELTTTLGSALNVDGTTVPAGAFVVDAADLPNLKILPPPNDSHDFNLTVWATSKEASNGDLAISGPQTIQVDVGVVAPSASGSGIGNEDDWQLLTLSANVNQADGSEALTVFLKDLPSDVQLAYRDGSAVPQGSDGRYEITGRLDDLMVRWNPATRQHTDQDISFKMVAEVRDGDTDSDSAAVRAAAPDFNSTEVDVNVTVRAVADQPPLAVTGVGVEDQWHDLDITTALVDTDGSETLSITVSGTAGSFTLRDAGGELTGTVSGGTVTYTLTPAQLSGLQLKGAQDSDADISLTVTATTTEAATGDQVALATSSRSQNFVFKVLSDADKPTVSVIDGTQTINEDQFFSLRDALVNTVDGGLTGGASEVGSSADSGQSGDGSETITYEMTARDANTRLWVDSDGDGSVDAGEVSTLAQGQTVELSRADILAGKVHVGGATDWASGTEVKFDFRTKATDTNDDALEASIEGGTNSLNRSTTAYSDVDTLTLKVNSVVDSGTAGLSVAASGFEDGLSGYDHTTQTGAGIAVTPTLTLTDIDGSEQPNGTVVITSTDAAMLAGSLTISGAGASITRVDATDGNGNITSSTWTITGGNFTEGADNVWTLGGLVFQPAEDSHADPRFTMTVSVVDTSTGATGTVTAADQTITVRAVADLPGLNTANLNANESASGPLDIGLGAAIFDVASPDGDSSETLYAYISGVPAGASLVGATVQTVTQNVVDQAGMVQFNVAQAGGTVYRVLASDLDQLSLRMPQGASDDVALKVWSVSVEAENGDVAVSAPKTVLIDIGVAAPSLAATATVTGSEDSWTALTGITASVNANDGTETLRVFVEDVPAGLQITTNNGASVLSPVTYVGSDGLTHTGYEITGKLDQVKVKWTAAHSDADADLKIRAIVYDRDVDLTNSTTSLTVDATKTDAGGIERATAITQPYSDWADQVVSVRVNVNAVADTPNLSASAVGVEDKFVALNIASTLTDTDGSESLTVTISDLPSELTLYQGGTALTANADGSYTLSAASNAEMATKLADLRLYGLAANSNTDSYGATTSNNQAVTATDFSLKVTVRSEDAGGSTATVTLPVNVSIYGDADTPVVKVVHGATEATAITMMEDTYYNVRDTLLAISGEDGSDPTVLAIASADGSESLSFRISCTNAVNGQRILLDNDGNGSFGAGDKLYTYNSATNKWVDNTGAQTTGYITVTGAQMSGGKVLVSGPAHWSTGTVEFRITPVATETDGDSGGENTAVTNALNASNSFDANAANDLSRAASATGAAKSLWLKLTPDADTTTVTVSAGGLEDSPGIAFAPTIQLTDTDGSEVLTGIQILVKGTMEGEFRLNGNVVAPADANGDGQPDTLTIDGTTYTVYQIPVTGSPTSSYTVSGLTYKPAEDSDADVTYRIRTVTTDTSGTGSSSYAAVTGEGTIVVKAVADSPALGIGNVLPMTETTNTGTAFTTLAVDEDGYLKVDLKANLTDTDGSETLTQATLTDVPQGWSVVYWDAASSSYQAYAYDTNSNTWTLDVAKLGNVYLHPPKDADADASLIKFNVTSTEAATGAQLDTASKTTSIAFDVVVNPVADQPNLLVTNARVLEDNLVKLDIRPALVDTDGSETLTVTIGDTNGGSFWARNADNSYTQYDASHVSNGTWTFSADEVKNLYFRPAANSNVDVDLSVTAVATDRGVSTAFNTQNLKVVVTGVADPSLVPLVDGIHVAAVTGTEGQVIDPSLESYVSVDTDGSESLSAVISGVPEGVTLFLDLNDNGQLNTGESTSGFLKYIGGGKWSVDPDHVANVRLLAPTDYSGTFQMSVTLITTENDGDYESVPAVLKVTVNPDADTPTGSISGSGNEDADSIAFTLGASVRDLGGGNAAIGAGGIESISAITNVVVDVHDMVTAVMAAGGAATSVFVRYDNTDYVAQADGSGHYSITIPSVSVPTGQTSVSIGGLALHGIPDNYSKDVSASMTVTAKDGSGATVDYADKAVTGKIVIRAIADEPYLAVKPDTDATPATIDHVASADGSTHTVTLVGADGGAVTRVTDTDTSESLYVVVSGVPNGVAVQGGVNNGDGSWTLPGGTSVASIKLVATSAYARTDANNDNVADDVTLTIKSIVTDRDPDGDVDTEDATISVKVNFGDFAGGGTTPTPTTIPEARIDGSLTATEDGTFSLSALKALITVVNDQGNADPADDQVLTIGADGVCSDGSTLSVVVAVPTGWSIGGSGHYLTGTDSGVSTYTIPYANLGNVTLTPPKDFSGVTSDLKMRAVVTTADGRYDSGAAALTTVPVTVTRDVDADGAAITATLQTVQEDVGTSAITLTIKPTDTDFSESLTSNEVTIRVTHQNGVAPGILTGSGSGYTLSAGTAQAGYTEYKLTITDSTLLDNFKTSGGMVIGGLAFDSANDFSGSVGLTVSVGVKDTAVVGGTTLTETGTSSASLSLNVTSVVDDTTFTITDATTTEDVAVALDATIAHSDLVRAGTAWASETMSVVIDGVPAGGTLIGAYNNGDGSWTVYDANLTYHSDGTVSLTNVKYVPAPDSAADVELTLVTYTREADGTTWVKTEATDTLAITVRADADGATINPQAVSETEDNLVALKLGAQVADSSELATITITGVPFDGAITDAAGNAVGTYAQSGSTWTVTFSADQVRDLDLLGSGSVYFKAPTNVSGSWTMATTIASVDIDPDDGQVDISTTSSAFAFTVTLAADADAPTLTMASTALTGTEDNAVTLNLATGLVDVDGSESLSLTLTGAPAGSIFYATTNGSSWTAHTVGADGTVTISGAVSNLRLLPPANYNGTITVQATATSTEASNADSATTSQTFTVAVSAVNDAPTLTLTGVAGLGIEAGAHTTPIMYLMNTANVVIADVESDAITAMSLKITGGIAGGALGLAGVSPVANAAGDLVVTVNGKEFLVDYDAGVLTFSSATASYADYKALLTGHVIFTAAEGTLGDGTGAVEVRLTDDEGGVSAALSVPVIVDQAGSSTPTTVSGSALGAVRFTDDGAEMASATVSSGNAPIALAGGLDLANGATMTGMTVTLDGMPGDTLALSGLDVTLGTGGSLDIGTTGVSVAYDGTGPSLVFTGSADSSVYESIAHSIVLSASSGSLAAGERTMSVTLFDQQGNPSAPLTTGANLTTNLTLAGDNLGDVRWGADGSATVDDVLIVQYGDSVAYLNGLGGTDTLMMQNNGTEGDWTFLVMDDQTIKAISASAPEKEFDIVLDQGSVDLANTTADQVVFNGDASGRIEFDQHTSIQFDNIDRLVG